MPSRKRRIDEGSGGSSSTLGGRQWAGRLIPNPYGSSPFGGSVFTRFGPISQPMETATRRRLGDIFVERGLIDEEQLREALLKQCETGAKLGEVLVDLGFVDRIALAGVITEQWDDARG